MATKTSICNMAILNDSGKNTIANIETDTSIEAKTCRTYYEQALEYVLADVDWGFATGRKALAVLSETVPVDWDHIYGYPSDCIKAREIYTSGRRTGTEKIAFEVNLNADKTVKAIFTNQEEALLRYTVNITDPNLFPAGFAMLLSWYLAYLIAMPLTKKPAVRDAAKKRYDELKQAAAVIDAEEEFDETPESEFITGR